MAKVTKIVLAVPVMLLLLAIAIPNFFPARMTISSNACGNNLRWIQKAKVKWGQNQSRPDTAVPTEDDLRPVLKALAAGDAFPECPAGGNYIIGGMREPVKCSIREPGHILPAD